MPSTLVAIESIAQEPAIVVAKHPYGQNSSSLTPLPPRQHQAAVTRRRPMTVKEMPGTCDVSHVIGCTRTS